MVHVVDISCTRLTWVLIKQAPPPEVTNVRVLHGLKHDITSPLPILGNPGDWARGLGITMVTQDEHVHLINVMVRTFISVHAIVHLP